MVHVLIDHKVSKSIVIDVSFDDIEVDLVVSIVFISGVKCFFNSPALSV